MTDHSSLSELTTHCIRCGFCLEACPTFTETGRETESPRGRIYLVRSAIEGKLNWTEEEVGQHLDTCLGCRACEPACPSGVEYGQILEGAREVLSDNREVGRLKMLLNLVTDPTKIARLLRWGWLLPGKRVPAFVSRLVTNEEPEAERPRAQKLSAWPRLAADSLPPVKGKVYLLEGCAMRVLFPRVHEATRRLLRRLGYEVQPTRAGCCGALHAHQGFVDEGVLMLRSVESAMHDNLPIVVNSAGCGSFMKEHGEAFKDRVLDVSEFLLNEGLTDLLGKAEVKGGESRKRVAYHEACHLVHGQRVSDPPRALLEAVPGIELVPLVEADTCCGSAGIYNLAQPKLARRLLERKWRNVEACGAEIVALGNPGCHAWIEQAAREKGSKVRVMHTVEVLEAAFSGWE